MCIIHDIYDLGVTVIRHLRYHYVNISTKKRAVNALFVSVGFLKYYSNEYCGSTPPGTFEKSRPSIQT
jgi:hypothetical protein